MSSQTLSAVFSLTQETGHLEKTTGVREAALSASAPRQPLEGSLGKGPSLCS